MFGFAMRSSACRELREGYFHNTLLTHIVRRIVVSARFIAPEALKSRSVDGGVKEKVTKAQLISAEKRWSWRFFA